MTLAETPSLDIVCLKNKITLFVERLFQEAGE